VRQRISADHSIADSQELMMDCVKDAYQQIHEQYVVDQVLQPQLLTKETFLGRASTLLPLNDTYMLGIANQVRSFVLDCSLLVAGFDGEGNGCVFTIVHPGTIISHAINGYGAIGVGAEIAMSRLVWALTEPEDDLDMALYQAYEAKAYAELIQGVGSQSDIWIMTPKQTYEVPIRIELLMRLVFNYSSQIPFKARIGWSPADPPPARWERTLRMYVKGIT
jgi:hypothetical protein